MPYRRSLGIAALSCVLCACQFQTYREKPIEPAQWVKSYEQRDLGAPGLRDFLPQCGLASIPWPRSHWDAAGLECAALYFHPDLVRARAAIEVARAQERTAGQRPNPSASLRLEHQGGDPKAGEPWGIGPQFDIPIERGGKRAARIERAIAEATVAEIDLDARIWEVRRSVRNHLLDLQEAQERLVHAREKLALLEQGESLLRRREELGLASGFEVSSMRIDAQRSHLAVSSAEAKANTASAELAASMTIPVSALRAVELDAMPGADAKPSLPDGATLQQQALTRRTDIRRALQEYVVAEKSLKEEVARQYPDFNFSPGYFFDPTDSINIWSFGVSMVLPLFNRNEGPIAEAEARRELAARNVESVQAGIIGEVQSASAGYADLQNALNEADTVIAELDGQEQRLQKQFALGETDRLSLLRARLETAEAKMSRSDLLIEQRRALFRLEDAVQIPLRREMKVDGIKP